MKRELTGEERERYSRQIMLGPIGEEGQRKIIASQVLVVGAGGLGSPVALYLTAAGVGRIGLVDSDFVGLSNLQRQILYTTSDLGAPKVDRAKEKLVDLNPHLQLETYRIRLTEKNVSEVIAGYDLVIIAVDNLATRYLLNEACFKAGKPLIEGAIDGFCGHVTTFLPPEGPCYQCLFPKKGDYVEKNGNPPGVIGYVPGLTGALQVGEALKIILGIGEPLVGKLLFFDTLNMEFKTIQYTRSPACPVCGNKS